ncbi:hypothetical protein N7539_007556 [Penicillium diatomitis]|uniref:LicD/FKTN/FKRP nucleotidyltransferase domain-containing protein n=1 Tax=Penicillium diatomitis TaxID=2819901 RepID=A0A9X0BPA0_9EURO|nr:uncharacterized protein N7539_007556 [Penicillium diatomitis]KAJ5477412.1 hypothetical protein N7539_007556 [Penicillium diatomitis]
MRLTICSLARLGGFLSTIPLAAALPSGETNFMSVRENVAKDYESVTEIPQDKYFSECSLISTLSVKILTHIHTRRFHYHYDGRFAESPLPDDQVTPHLSALIRTYLTTMASIGAETWIMHGTLLAWWWNQKVSRFLHLHSAWLVTVPQVPLPSMQGGPPTHIFLTQIFPWDNDLDVQISEPTIHFLADYYNMTQHHFDIPGVSGGRTYLLEINPHYVVRTTQDRLNVIDGRWIDTSSGLFIDITAVRKDDEQRQRGNIEALMCKDHHRYDESQIFPLRDSYFEDVPVKVPYAYTWLLEEEYGPKSMTNKFFGGHKFNDETKVWDPIV